MYMHSECNSIIKNIFLAISYHHHGTLDITPGNILFICHTEYLKLLSGAVSQCVKLNTHELLFNNQGVTEIMQGKRKVN